jgi:hypothetical protein
MWGVGLNVLPICLLEMHWITMFYHHDAHRGLLYGGEPTHQM